jgi:hypothetical protein
MRSAPAWDAARRMPKASPLQRKARSEAFAAVRQAHGFSEYQLQSVATEHKNAAGFADRIGIHETQKIGTRVLKALEEYLSGARGRPRFKGKQRPLHSLEGKNNQGMLQWKPEVSVLQVERGWMIPVRMPDLRKDEWLAAALQHRTKYCRVVWRNIDGHRKWFVQLVQDGKSPIKASVLSRLAPEGSVGGLDLGPSVVAWVTDTAAGVQRLAPEVERPHAAIRVLQRQVDRQRRANNPDNFHADGRVKKGYRKSVASQRQILAERKLANLLRYEADVRKQAHGRDINMLVSKALIWRDDGVSPKALQKMYGRSIGVRAPGHFMDELARKAERAGGQRQIIDVRRLKTSQYDHTTDTFTKKALSERWHVFGDGSGRAHRDIYSAFLARHASPGEVRHQPETLARAWSELASVLHEAGWAQDKLRSDGPSGRVTRVGSPTRQSGSLESSEKRNAMSKGTALV